MKWRFGQLDRNPKPKDELPLERVQDADLGLHAWEMEEREKAHAAELEDLKKVNGIDYLTGAASRKTFDAYLNRSLELIRGELAEKRAGAEQLTKLSLVLMDIDHFKKINDTLGHHAGDIVLKEAAQALMQSVRGEDLVARWGGEEFFVLLRDANLDAAKQRAEEFRHSIEKLSFPQYPDLRVTASFGVVSSAVSEDGPTLEKSADEALYKAKEGGRNRVEIYTDHEPVSTALE